MITIKIIKIRTSYDENDNPKSRAAIFIIQENSGPVYWYAKGGLSLTGNIQDLLDAEATEL